MMGRYEKTCCCHIITGLNTGGAERALYNLLQGGMGTRFDCHIVSLMGDGTMGPRIRELGVPVTALGMRQGVPLVSVVNRLRRVVKELQPNLIQGWMYHGNLAAWLVRLFLPNKPLLAWNVRHSIYDLAEEKTLTRRVIKANRFFSEAPDVLLYNSNISRTQHEHLGFCPNKGRVIPNGIDIDTYSLSAESRMHVRRELGIPPEAKVVGHVARLHPMKDHPQFLSAAVRIASRHNDIHFILCGRGVTLENSRLGQLVPAAMRCRFHLLGERSDIQDLMCAMDLFTSTSSYGEGFPNVLGEAMACGLPCVATDVGDSAMIVSDTGVVVPPRNEDAFLNATEHLLLMPEKERQALGGSARTRIVNNFTLQKIVEQYSVLYENLILNKRYV